MRICVGLSVIALTFLFVLPSCNPDTGQNTDSFELTVRIGQEPDNLNPMRSKSRAATPIESQIALPLAEFDPGTLQLTPLIIKSLGSKEELTDGEFAGGERYTYVIREEASWDNGDPITGYDYEFTLKAALNPEVDAPDWRAYLSFIKAVEIDVTDPRRFSVVVAEPYMLAEAITCNFNLMPKYFYDPDGLLDPYTIGDLLRMGEEGTSAEQEPLVRFAHRFSSAEMGRDTVVGCGPYVLEEWISGQHIILKRKNNWWGDQITDSPDLLKAYPDRIVYRIIPDETSAIASIKDGSCDLAAGLSATAFNQLRNDPQWQEKLDFHTPVLLQYRYLEINNRDEVLRDKSVRKALAHVIDYDAIIENVELGEGQRTVGPFSPSKDYYNNDLPLIQYDIEAARRILEEAGWFDSNNNGTRDKVIDGQLTELELQILTTQSPMGQQVALITKEGGSQVGMEIDVVTKDASSWRQAISQRDFEILPMQVRSSPAPQDPYSNWHSDSDQPGGANRSGFRNDQADAIIEQIRSTETAEDRHELYMKLQEVIYEEQPVVFLYVPVERIVTTNRIQMQPSSRRPGYFVNLIRPAES